MKGWQNRWFVLDPLTGMLEYFMVTIVSLGIIFSMFFFFTKLCSVLFSSKDRGGEEAEATEFSAPRRSHCSAK